MSVVFAPVAIQFRGVYMSSSRPSPRLHSHADYGTPKPVLERTYKRP